MGAWAAAVRWGVVGVCFAVVLGGPVGASAAQPGGRGPDYREPLTTRLLHLQNVAARSSRGLPKSPIVALREGPGSKDELTSPDMANIAVVDDGDGVLLPALPFDLDNQTLVFQPLDPAGEQYRYEVRSGGYDTEAVGEGETVPLGDDDSTRWVLPFTFSFFGKPYGEVFINSDGNLTFVQGDSASTPRDPARAVSGPPRMAGFFSDLDPSQDGAAVRVRSTADRLVVTWINVPEWLPSGLGRPQNFQIVLHADGRIEFAYRGITLNNAIVGIASAARLNDSLAVDFSEPSSEVFSAAVVEIFLPAELDFASLAQKFYLNHEDAYDLIVIFHNYDLGLDLQNAFAFYLGVRNTVRGIGPAPSEFEDLNLFDLGSLTGSAQRLQGLMFMGPLENYPDDPNGRIDRSFGLGVSTPLTVLAHEAGHRFLARPLFVDPEDNLLSAELLGRQNSHWSYYFNSEASFLEGNRIVDHGPGAGELRFETVAVIKEYSPLDLYLMGLIPPDEVPASFLVRNPSIADGLFTSAHEPLAGIFFGGQRVDITLDMVLEAHGRRTPDHTLSQKYFRLAFVLLKEEGKEIPAADVEKLERFRAAFEQYFAEVTGNRAFAETELVSQLGLTTWPAAGVLQGGSTQQAVFLAEPSSGAVTIQLSADAGIEVPAEVTIPAGEQFVEFAIGGVQPGVSMLSASAGDGYEVAHSNIHVLATPAGLSIQRILPLELLLGDPRERLRTGRIGQPLPYDLFFLIVDDNGLTYPEVRVRLTASGDGFAEPADAMTDVFGFATASWTLASAPGENQLRVEVEGSSRPAVVVTAIGVREPHRNRDVRSAIFGR